MEETTLNKIVKPWGYYIDHYRSDGCVQKTIYVKPGHKLSYQYHNFRSEFWYIEFGEAKITVNSSCIFVRSGFKIEIDQGVKHRLENLSDDWLIVHEMQFGKCDENDIVRLEDDYHRVYK